MEKASAIKSLAISACAILLVVACVFGLAACGGYSTGGVEAGNFKGTTNSKNDQDNNNQLNI